MDERELVERLKHIQALYIGATTAGERAAANKAYDRVNTRLEQERYTKATEYKFSMADHFQRRLFTALARKHGLRPYRYKRQRYTTVVLQASPKFIDEVLWPEFEKLSETLGDYLSQVTERVIAQAVHADQSDAAIAKEIGAAHLSQRPGLPSESSG